MLWLAIRFEAINEARQRILSVPCFLEAQKGPQRRGSHVEDDLQSLQTAERWRRAKDAQRTGTPRRLRSISKGPKKGPWEQRIVIFQSFQRFQEGCPGSPERVRGTGALDDAVGKQLQMVEEERNVTNVGQALKLC